MYERIEIPNKLVQSGSEKYIGYSLNRKENYWIAVDSRGNKVWGVESWNKVREGFLIRGVSKWINGEPNLPDDFKAKGE